MVDDASDRRRATRWRQRWRWIVILLVVLLVFHVPLLRLCTDAVIVREPMPGHVDAILIAGGDDRHGMAARWVKSGFADTILLPRRLADRNVAAGIVPPEDVFTRQKLLDLGVSDRAILCLNDVQLRGEWRKQRLLGEWLRAHPQAQVVILCDQFDSRWTRHVVDRVLPVNAARRVIVHGLPSLLFDERAWWRSRPAATKLFASGLALAYARWVGEDEDEPVTWDADAYEKSLKCR